MIFLINFAGSVEILFCCSTCNSRMKNIFLPKKLFGTLKHVCCWLINFFRVPDPYSGSRMTLKLENEKSWKIKLRLQNIIVFVLIFFKKNFQRNSKMSPFVSPHKNNFWKNFEKSQKSLAFSWRVTHLDLETFWKWTWYVSRNSEKTWGREWKKVSLYVVSF